MLQKIGHYANKFYEETTVKMSNVLGKKGSNFLMMKEDMLDSSLDDDNIEDYKESDAEYDNLGAIEEAEQEDSDLNNKQKKYKVTHDSSANTGFVHKTDGTNRVFMPSKKRLFFSDVKGDTVHVLVNTVEKNKNKYMGNSTLIQIKHG